MEQLLSFLELIVNWFIQNGQSLYNVITGSVLVLAYIVKLTKNTQDDVWYTRFVELLRKLSLIP